jgi:hypothetical protein
MTKKRIIFAAVLLVLNLIVLEVILQISIKYQGIYSSHPVAIVHYLSALTGELEEEKLREINEAQGPTIWNPDSRFGYLHHPSSSMRYRSPNYDVKYNIDGNGNRVMPVVESPLGRILFLGGSMTFGHGIEDHETYPAVLATNYWPRFQVVNRAINGWGTAHSYLALLEEIASNTPPSLVVYGFIPPHASRNYIRKEWVKVVAPSKHPHFEIKDGELKYMGVVGVSGSKEGGEEVERKELELTSAFIEAMDKLCREKGIPFVVLLVPTKRPLIPSVIDTLLARDIDFIDQSKGRHEGFPMDAHLNPNDHKALAKVLSKSVVAGMVDKIRARTR